MNPRSVVSGVPVAYSCIASFARSSFWPPATCSAIDPDESSINSVDCCRGARSSIASAVRPSQSNSATHSFTCGSQPNVRSTRSGISSPLESTYHLSGNERSGVVAGVGALVTTVVVDSSVASVVPSVVVSSGLPLSGASGASKVTVGSWGAVTTVGSRSVAAGGSPSVAVWAASSVRSPSDAAVGAASPGISSLFDVHDATSSATTVDVAARQRISPDLEPRRRLGVRVARLRRRGHGMFDMHRWWH